MIAAIHAREDTGASVTALRILVLAIWRPERSVL